MTVIVEVLAEYSGIYDAVAEKFRAIEDVTQVYLTMGETDFIVIAHLTDSDMVEGLISDFEALEKVERTNSTFVISTLKDSQRAIEA